jgi:hypothetical protein
LAALLASTGAAAQTSPIDKGSWLVSGQGYFLSTSVEGEDDRLMQASTALSSGSFVAPGVMVGGTIQFTSIGQGNSSASTWLLGPKLAYFFGADQDREVPGAVYPYIGASLSFLGWSNGGSASGTQVQLGAGLAYTITRSVALSFEGLYRVQTIEEETNNTFGILVGFSFFIWE